MQDNAAEEQSEAQEIEELNKLFSEGEAVDKAHFAEQRTAILMYKGDFFKKKTATFLDRNKDSLTENTKLKLSENHTQVVGNRLISSIVNECPSVLFVPNNDNEQADIKDAELSNSVRAFAEKKLNFENKVERLANNFVVPGEALTLTYWDPFDGDLVGYEQKTTPDGVPLHKHPVHGEVVDTHMESVDPMTGQPTMQPLEMVADEKKPQFKGLLKIKLPHPYNTIRAKAADNMEESPFICFREMISKSEAKTLIPKDANDEEKKEILAEIEATSGHTYKIFDSNTGEYSDTKDQVLIRYWFFRKCYKYAKGYFKVQIGQSKVVSKGELPFGVWPIAYAGFRTVAGSCRAVSYIRDIRPAQTHLNYLISNQAFHMVALADDKIITQMGTKLQMGASWNGIRSYSVNGPPPVIMPGRDAAQFDKAIERCVAVIYRLADDGYQLEESKIQDAEAALYQRLSAKQKHSQIAKKFEHLLCETWQNYMDLAKHYLDDTDIINRVGKREAINIAEFKASRSDGYRIKAKPVSGTIEEMQGNAMEIRTILQYVGKDLPKTVIAKLVNRLPFLSKESVMGELLLTEKNIDNDILALDRGEWVEAAKDDDHVEYIRRLKSRMKSADFKQLDPQIQQMYQQRLQQHTQFQAQLAAELKEAEAGFWPMDGGLVKVDLYDAKGKRMLMPQAALVKLQGLLEQQGAGQDQLHQLDQNSQADIQLQALQIAQQHMQAQHQPQMQPPHGVPQQPQDMGMAPTGMQPPHQFPQH